MQQVVIALFHACVGKIAGVTCSSRLMGDMWREALSLGVLMNTRGLIELIVLNVGLQLGILSPTLVAMFVVMAVVTTMMAAPLLSLLGYSITNKEDSYEEELESIPS